MPLALVALLLSDRREPVDWVNPNVGGVSQLLVPTYPTMGLPYGMLRVYPQREAFTSPYLSGLPLAVTGHRGGSAVTISPFAGETRPVGRYAYDLEKARPERYDVRLEEPGIDVAFAPSRRAAVYRFDFEKGGARAVSINARNGYLRFNDGTIEGPETIGISKKPFPPVYSDGTVSGYQELGGARVYFVAAFSVAPNAANSNGTTVTLKFPKDIKRLSVRYAVSFIDEAQARRNLAEDAPDFDVERLAREGRKAWNDALGRVTVEGGEPNATAAFYTALYRAMERPMCVSEDGRYFSGFDGKVHDDDGVPFSTDDWTWDTFRAAHPLRGILDPTRESSIVASYVRMAGQSPEGWMPTFPAITGDQHLMNGNHYVSVIWDAWRNGLRGFDLAAAYEACKRTVLGSSMTPWMRHAAGPLDAFYQEKGYWPALRPGERETVAGVHGFERRQAVPVTLAASYDSWCLGQMARASGRTEDAALWDKRALNYRNLFNPETAFFHPKDAEGRFIEPFDYKFSGGIGARDYYDENNGWTYRWDVQHNPADLVRLMGGRERFVANLDATFAEPLGMAKYEYQAQLPDSTGLVGQFVMGNEPSLHIPYLYNYAGAPWKTQKRVRMLLETFFRNDLQGIPGDEDGGGLSAFVAFSSMGFYPVTPGTGVYAIGSPVFPRSALHLANGRTFVVEAKGCSHDAKYVQSARLNGRALDRPWFTHEDLFAGGKLELGMGERPNEAWGAAPGMEPPSMP